MRKLSFALAALLALAFAATANAQTYHQPWRPQTFRPGVQQMGVAGGGGGGFTGPGDVVSGAKVWVGLRAYNATWADGAHKAIRVIRASDSQLCDVFLNTSGNLGNVTSCTGAATGSVATFCNATTCSIDVFYDQSGNTNDFFANSSSNRAVLAFSCLGSLPCADFTSATAFYQAIITDTAQPLTVSVVAIRTGNFTTQNSLFGVGNGTFFDAAVNTAGAYFGNSATATASDSTWHAMQIVVNSTSAAVAVDATQTSGLNSGTNNIGTNIWLGSNNSIGGKPLTGKLTEIGMWTVAFTPTQQTNVCHNQFAYWGTPTSC